MTIVWVNPAPPGDFLVSGGTRKLLDLSAILAARGFSSRVLHTQDAVRCGLTFQDLVVVPEVMGQFILTAFPVDVPRVGFVQNPFLIDKWGCPPNAEAHPYMTTRELKAVLTESEHSTRLMHHRFPNLPCPVIRTHSSGNGRNGEDAGFHFGEWPRRKVICYFEYKHDDLNKLLMEDFPLLDGWEFECLSGHTDEEIAELMRTCSIFVAPNVDEGMCAPTSEAMISGCRIVAWPGSFSKYGFQPNAWCAEVPGAGPDEYMRGHAVLAEQDNMVELRALLLDEMSFIEMLPETAALNAKKRSDWFQATYSRQGEIDEIVRIMTELHGVR